MQNYEWDIISSQMFVLAMFLVTNILRFPWIAKNKLRKYINVVFISYERQVI